MMVAFTKQAVKETNMGHHVAVETNRKLGFWASKPGYKPILLLIAALVFVAVVIVPPLRV